MKKIQFSIILLFSFFSLVFSQLGINTNASAATLDVMAKNATGISTNVDGLLIPRVDRQRAQSMTAIPVSTLIYVNSIATGTLAGTAINIDAVGYYYFNGTIWIKLNPTLNLYTTSGTLLGNRTVTTGGNSLSLVNGTNSTITILTPATEGKLTAFGSSRGTVTLNGGSANMDIYIDNANSAQINSSGNISKLSFGTTNATPLAFKTNGIERVNILSNGNLGIGNSSPNTTLELTSGTANTSGLRLATLTSASPVGIGQALGVDASGNLVTVANPSPTTVTTSSVNSVTGSSFNVNDLSATTVSGTTQSITVPTGGKALFLNFMLGIDYTSTPAGGSAAYYEARLYIDGTATDCYMRVQEIGAGASAFFNLCTVKFLTAGVHSIDVRMQRTFNNGTTSGANMACNPISMSFNASYLN